MALVSAPTAVRQSMPSELLPVKNLENPSQHKHLICISGWTEAGLTRLCTTWNGSGDQDMADGFAEARQASSLCLQHSCGSIISVIWSSLRNLEHLCFSKLFSCFRLLDSKVHPENGVNVKKKK